MSASIYIVVEGEDPGFNTFVNGRMLAQYESSVAGLAQRLRVTPLIEFFSADQAAMATLIEEGAGDARLLPKLPVAQWFTPGDALRSVNALVAALEEDHAALGPETPLVLAELREFEAVLTKTQQRNLRWHLAVSFR